LALFSNERFFNKVIVRPIFVLLIATFLIAVCSGNEVGDPWLFLEEIDGINALVWVDGQNERTSKSLEFSPQFAELYQQALDVLNSESRIPNVFQRGKYLYNLWNDSTHPRRLYRRTTLDEFRKTNPNWKTVLDIDALSKKEGKPWVFQDMRCLPDAYSKCLVFLSPGGTDASEVRELNTDTLSFVTDGFFLPAAKTEASWIDDDHIFVSTDFGEGSLTHAGFSRMVKIWKRRTKLQDANTILEIDPRSIQANAYRIRTASDNIDLVLETVSTWTTRVYQIIDDQLLKLICLILAR
jgi:prolyl oligopeptidase